MVSGGWDCLSFFFSRFFSYCALGVFKQWALDFFNFFDFFSRFLIGLLQIIGRGAAVNAVYSSSSDLGVRYGDPEVRCT